MFNTEKIKTSQYLTRRRLSRNALLSGLIPMILLLLMMGLTLFVTQNIASVSALVVRVGEEIDVLNEVRVNLLDIETGERGYIITGNPAYLAPHQHAMQQIRDNVLRLESLLGARQNLSPDLIELSQHIKRKIEISEANIAARNNSFSAAIERVNLGVGKREMDVIRVLLNSIDEKQHSLRRDLRTKRSDGMRNLWSTLASTAGLLLIIMVYLYFRNLSFLKDQRNADRQAHHLATHDVLTNLPNRQMLMYELNRMLNQMQRYGKKSALLFLDLNEFKIINDTFGHAAGDELLVQVAGRLQSLMRSSDMVARLGGDEFVVLLEKVENEEDVHIVRDKVLQEIGMSFVLSTGTVSVSISIGMAFYPRDGKDAESLMHYADARMYEMKRVSRKVKNA